MQFARAVHAAAEVAASAYKILVTMLLGYYLLKKAKELHLEDRKKQDEVHP